MAGLGDLLGRNGVLEQLLLWGVVNQVISASSSPAFALLQQDVSKDHPVAALDPVTAADAAARDLMTEGAAEAEARLSGVSAARWKVLSELHKVRLDPSDLATAVLRSAVTEGEALSQLKPQGITPDMLKLLVYLAGDALGPEQLVEALRRDIIHREGSGQDSTSYDQGIKESRLHDKWGPVLVELAKQLLSPPDAASAVVRNFASREAMTRLAEQQGIDAATFSIMTDLAADAPGPQQLAEALRRGAIEEAGTGAASTSFEQGIAEGRLAAKWAPVIKALAQLWPTPVDAINALVKGQIPPDEGLAMYERLGGDPQFYQWLLDSAGDAPSPLEAADMAARGIIPWEGTGPDKTSFAQAVREGRLKDKWIGPTKAAAKYLPPPGEIITFLAHTAITAERARELLTDHYMDPDVLAAFINEADLTDLSDYRGLTQSSVVDMYYARLITADQATAILEMLHVTPKAAPLLLAYADMRQVIDSISKSVQRIAGLFTGRKISVGTAREALMRLEIAPEQVEQIIETWEIQANANVKTLTQAQIIDAWYYEVIDQETAIRLLGAVGYTPFDSWVLLSVKAKGRLPGEPPADIAPSVGVVIPGTT